MRGVMGRHGFLPNRRRRLVAMRGATVGHGGQQWLRRWCGDRALVVLGNLLHVIQDAFLPPGSAQCLGFGSTEGIERHSTLRGLQGGSHCLHQAKE